MYEALNIQTNTYVVTQKDGFFVDIQQNGITKTCEAYLWHKDYGDKMLMFGVINDNRFRDFYEKIEDELHRYIAIYENEVMV